MAPKSSRRWSFGWRKGIHPGKFKKENSVELKLDWKNGYGSLDKGKYRLVKNVSIEKVDGSSEEFNVYGEFSID